MSGPTDVTAKIVRPVTPCVLDVFYGDWPGTGDVDKRLAAVKADGVAAATRKKRRIARRRETVETVSVSRGAGATPLKEGVNDRSIR